MVRADPLGGTTVRPTARLSALLRLLRNLRF